MDPRKFGKQLGTSIQFDEADAGPGTRVSQPADSAHGLTKNDPSMLAMSVSRPSVKMLYHVSPKQLAELDPVHNKKNDYGYEYGKPVVYAGDAVSSAFAASPTDAYTELRKKLQRSIYHRLFDAATNRKVLLGHNPGGYVHELDPASFHRVERTDMEVGKPSKSIEYVSDKKVKPLRSYPVEKFDSDAIPEYEYLGDENVGEMSVSDYLAKAKDPKVVAAIRAWMNAQASQNKAAAYNTVVDGAPYRDRAEVYSYAPEHGIYGGQFDNDKTFAVPGGGVDEGEDIAAAASREFLEETGMRVKNPRVLPIDPVTTEWSPEHKARLPPDRQKYRGSRTHFVHAEPDDLVPGPGKLDRWGAGERRFYTLDEALKVGDGKTPLVPNVFAARMKVLEHLRSLATPSVLPLLQQAKAESDKRNYSRKAQILRGLMQQVPADWLVDSPRGPHHGVTHLPTRFKFHLPPRVIPATVKKATMFHGGNALDPRKFGKKLGTSLKQAAGPAHEAWGLVGALLGAGGGALVGAPVGGLAGAAYGGATGARTGLDFSQAVR